MLEFSADGIIGSIVWGIFTGILFYAFHKIFGFDIEQPLSAIAILPILFTYMHYFYSALNPMSTTEFVDLFTNAILYTVGLAFTITISEIASNASDSITNIFDSISRL